MNYSDKAVYLQTHAIKIYRVVFEILKDILPETNITFSNNAGKPELKILDMTETLCVTVNIKINDANFYCNQNQYTVGVDLKKLSDIFKAEENSDSLILYITNNETQLLKIETMSTLKKRTTSHILTTLDLQPKNINKEIIFKVHISINTEDFHKICRDMKKVSDALEITCTNRTLTFTSKQNMTSISQVSYMHTDDNTDGVKIRYLTNENNIVNKNMVIRNTYDLKHLILFSKCNNFCPKLDMYLNDEIFPLCLNYNIGDIGSFRALICPITNTQQSSLSDTNEINY